MGSATLYLSLHWTLARRHRKAKVAADPHTAGMAGLRDPDPLLSSALGNCKVRRRLYRGH